MSAVYQLATTLSKAKKTENNNNKSTHYDLSVLAVSQNTSIISASASNQLSNDGQTRCETHLLLIKGESDRPREPGWLGGASLP